MRPPDVRRVFLLSAVAANVGFDRVTAEVCFSIKSVYGALLVL